MRDRVVERARVARTIRGFGDLNGLEFVAKVGIDKDRNNPSDEGRNVIAAASADNILAVMFFALMFGVGLVLTRSESANTLKRAIEGLFEVSMTLIGGLGSLFMMCHGGLMSHEDSAGNLSAREDPAAGTITLGPQARIAP